MEVYDECVDIIGNYCIPVDPACEQYKTFFQNRWLTNHWQSGTGETSTLPSR